MPAIWRAECDPAVLRVHAEPAAAEDHLLLDLTRLACPVLVLRAASGVEHVMIGDATCQVRLDLMSGTILDGRVCIRCELISGSDIETKLLTVQRLIALMRLGRFPRRLAPLHRRARRWMMALQACDARRAGASHREIAAVLFGQAMVDADWDSVSAYLRCRVQRLIRLGEGLIQGGYRQLLR